MPPIPKKTIAQCSSRTGLLTLKWEVMYCALEHAIFPIQRDICGGQDHENLADVIALGIRPWAPNCSWPIGSVISSTVNGYIQHCSAKLAWVLFSSTHDGQSAPRTDMQRHSCAAEWNSSKFTLCSKFTSETKHAHSIQICGLVSIYQDIWEKSKLWTVCEICYEI